VNKALGTSERALLALSIKPFIKIFTLLESNDTRCRFLLQKEVNFSLNLAEVL